MHTDRNTEHGRKRDQVGTDVTVRERPVIGSPVRHDAVHVFECRIRRIEVRHKPSGRPPRIGALIQFVMHVFRQNGGVALRDLKHGTESGDHIQAVHCERHSAFREETTGETAAAEVTEVRRSPFHGVRTGFRLFLGDLPERLHRGFPVFALLAGGIHRGRAGIDEMDQTGNIDFLAGRLFDGFRAPVSTDIGEAGSGTGQKMTEQHRHTVAGIVFRCKNIGFANTVPVERRIENGLHEVAVGHEVGPLTLPLESGGDRVVPAGLFHESHFREFFIADHEVAGNDRHLGDVFPDFFLFRRRLSGFSVVNILVLPAVLLNPGNRLFVFFGIVDILVHAADDFALINGFTAHSEEFLKEIGIDDGTCDPHCDAAHRKIAFAAHVGDRKTGTHKTENLLFHIRGNLLAVLVLHVTAVNAERGNTLLGVSGKYGCEIDRSGTLGSVEAPNGFRSLRIHVHRFGTVAPAGSDGQGDADVFPAEFVRAGGSFRNSADRGVRDHAFNRGAVRVTKRGRDELSGGNSHLHGLFLQRFADSFPSAVDRGTDPDFRVCRRLDDGSGFRCGLDCFLLSFCCHTVCSFFKVV